MTLYEMLDMLTAESPKIFLIAFVLMSLIQVAPIKINPFTFSTIGFASGV